MSNSAPVVHLEDYAARRAAGVRTETRSATGSEASAWMSSRALAGTGESTTAPARHRPDASARRRRAPRPHVVRACERPPALRDAPVELTRRGWAAVALVVVLLVACGLAGTHAWAQRGAAGSDADPTGSSATTTVTVQPGQTLWEIAEQAAPRADVRVTVDKIAQLNGLTSAGDVQAGQRLIVPAPPRH